MWRSAVLVLFVGAVLALALGPAPKADDYEPRLAQAREEAGLGAPPPKTHELPAGQLELSASELLAASGRTLGFTARLDREVKDGTLVLTVPPRWNATSAVSDLPFADVPGEDRKLVLAFGDGDPGDERSAEIEDIGIPAGTYTVAWRWTESGRSPTEGSAAVRFVAPVREELETEGEEARNANNPWTRLTVPGVEANATSDSGDTQSETFVTVEPGNPQRFIVGANQSTAGYSAWITNDGGQTFSKAVMATLTDQPGTATNQTSVLCCDPISAADTEGNLWYGGLTSGASSPRRIVVARAAGPSGTSFVSPTVGLAVPAGSGGTQDKPMMTIDNTPASPTYGRLYVAWGAPVSGGVRIAISMCDTRPGGTLNAALCDDADNWTVPVFVTPGTGSYIYADVAVGPDGKVYVVWWDYSSVNAIRGVTCATACSTQTAWDATPASTIATLDATGGSPLPFACPIIAQPGGRASTSPSVEVDRSGGPDNNRVWVSWSDLRTGSGSTRCARLENGDGTPPELSHLTFDSFIASASGQLPGSANPSPAVATRLLTDGEDGGQANSDDWFPWIAVDQTNGKLWANFYSTREDATRQTTKLYMRAIRPSGGGHLLGGLITASSAASDYSANPCCEFGNDYGDYTGIDVTNDVAIPVWSNKQGTAPGPDGEAFVFVTTADAAPPDTSIASGTGAGGLTNDPTPDFGLAASEPGSVFECRIDGGAFAPCPAAWTTPALSDRSHTIAVRAMDPAGNVDDSPVSRSFTVDATAPDTDLVSRIRDGELTNRPRHSFQFSSRDSTAVFQCQLDGAAFAGCTSPVRSPVLADGTHTFAVRAIDRAGNVDASPASRSFTVDTIAPETSFVSGLAEGGTTTAVTPAFGLAASEAGSTFECAVDGAALVACVSPLTTPALLDGPHRVSARATDPAGNADPTPATRAFTVLHPVTISRLRVSRVRVSAGRKVTLPRPKVSCPAGQPACSLQTTARAALVGRRLAVVGSSRRTIAPGRAAGARFTLSQSAFRVLQRRGRLRSRITLAGKHGTKTRTVRMNVTLLAP